MAEHELRGESCKCGTCKCPKQCKYWGHSRNCHTNCNKIGGHPGDDHICDVADHLCNVDCYYKNISQNCNKKCKEKCFHHNSPPPSYPPQQPYAPPAAPLQHQTNNPEDHICSLSKESHGCSGQCDYYEISKCCDKKCILEVAHKKLEEKGHKCRIPLEGHICKERCSFYEYCNQNCVKCFNHKDNNNNKEHLCSFGYNHICNKPCSYYSNPGVECTNQCKLIARHTEQNHKCNGNHVCNQICKYYNNSRVCNQFCSNPLLNHDQSIAHCCNIGNNHKCKNNCSKPGCPHPCKLSALHEGICVCINRHNCDEICNLFEGNICSRRCQKEYGHTNLSTDDKKHNCCQEHYCNKKCYYNDIKMRTGKGGCNSNCCLTYNHPGRHICTSNLDSHQLHPCPVNCYLFEVSNGCEKECSLIYLHTGQHLCKEKKLHKCKEKCELCGKYCGHVYNHKEGNLYCAECNRGECRVKIHHLCGEEHKCKQKCTINYCKIEDSIEGEEKKYRDIPYWQMKMKIPEHNDCKIPIPKNEYCHYPDNVHKCNLNENQHICGEKCKQCEYYCTKVKHSSTEMHKCNHGNVKNAKVLIFDSDSAVIKKSNELYQFSKEESYESAKIFTCKTYCSDQGQGHTHIFKSRQNINDKEVRIVKYDFNTRFYTYECICPYFWKNILKFEDDFNYDEINKFYLCNWKCEHNSHKANKERIFCKCPLWHKEDYKDQHQNLQYQWEYKGHLFDCKHNTVYTIFLVDQSGSMESKSKLPSLYEYKEKLDNMLGCTIEVIIDYCKKRNQINHNDICSLIAYSTNAKPIFKKLNVWDPKIKEECLSNLHPDGATYFVKAFKEADKLIKDLRKDENNNFNPVIILLTDGLDHDSKATLDFLNNTVSKKFFI